MPRPIYAEAQPVDGRTDWAGRDLEVAALDAGFWRYVREEDGRVWLVTLGPKALLVSEDPEALAQSCATTKSVSSASQTFGEADA